ncbi:MAG: homoserine dehydrogenase [Candidatus Sumerlaeaceae bacterium]
MDTINVGLIGFGNIGTGLVNAINANGATIAQRVGIPVKLTRIADVDTRRKRECEYDPAILGNDANALIDDTNIHIVVELVGGLEPARTFVERALRAGKHVVTANKAMLATFGADLWRLANEQNVALMFEASVGGGIPIIRALQSGLSANHIRAVQGILNGTCNYILTHMERDGRAFEVVLAEAQAHGFAEPDPTYDVEGYDTAHKTAVLASLAFQQDIRFADVFVEGISRLKPVDLDNARRLGYKVKLLGIAKRDASDGRVEVRVHPTLVPQDSLIANVSGVFNAVVVEGDLVGKTLFYGRGAGQSPTSSAILSDIMMIAADTARGIAPTAEHRMVVPVGERSLKPIAELETSYYLRVTVADRPGAMATLSGILAKHNISINSMLQKGDHPAGRADVIIVTHKAREKDVQSALDEIAGTDVAQDKPFVLRVEEEV